MPVHGNTRIQVVVNRDLDCVTCEALEGQPSHQRQPLREARPDSPRSEALPPVRSPRTSYAGLHIVARHQQPASGLAAFFNEDAQVRMAHIHPDFLSERQSQSQTAEFAESW